MGDLSSGKGGRGGKKAGSASKATARAAAEREKRKSGMPSVSKAALQGSEKQIAWAEDIRNKHIAATKSYLAEAEARAAHMKKTGNFSDKEATILKLRRQITQSVVDDIASNTSAKDFIENSHFPLFKSRAVAKHMKNISTDDAKKIFKSNAEWRRWI